MIPLVIAGIGAAGMAYGMMKDRQKYNSPNYSDIDLAKDNPELYAQLMKYEQLGKELEAQYAQRMTGPSASEQRAKQAMLDNMRGSLAARGSLGGSTELLAARDVEQQFMDQVAQNMRAEQAALMQQRLAQGAQQYNMFAQGQGDIMNKLSQEAMIDYQSRVAEDEARNKFFAGLMSGGMGMYGAQIGADAASKNAAVLAAQNAQYQGVPTYQAVPQQAPVYYRPAPYNPAPYYQPNVYSPSRSIG